MTKIYFTRSFLILTGADSESARGVQPNTVLTHNRKCWIHLISLGYRSNPKYSQPLLFIQSTLVISNSKGLSEILRDIRTSTYQICRIE